MSSPARAPQRAPRPTGRSGAAGAATAARPIEADGPQLRVVDRPATGATSTRRTTAGALGVVLVGCLFVAVFGLVVFQALLAQTQSRLDVLDGQVSSQEDRARQLERQRADLESPDRIVAEAERLNMVPPDEVVYLEPGMSDDQRAIYDPNAPAPKPVTPPTKVAPTTTTPRATTPTTVTPTSKATTATTKATTPTTKATTPTTKATTPATKATTPTSKPTTTPSTRATTATTKATSGR